VERRKRIKKIQIRNSGVITSGVNISGIGIISGVNILIFCSVIILIFCSVSILIFCIIIRILVGSGRKGKGSEDVMDAEIGDVDCFIFGGEIRGVILEAKEIEIEFEGNVGGFGGGEFRSDG